MTDTTPRIEVTIAAPADTVWNALRDKETLRNWHGWDFDGLEEEIDVIYFTAFTEDAEARTLDVQGGDLFEVTPHGPGAKVTLTRAPHGSNPEWEQYYDDITESWTTFLHQLKFALERHPGEARRTIFLGGEGDRAGSPIDELALADITGRPAGTAYDADLLGEPVRGMVWYRSEHQLGLTVDAWGDGLLVIRHGGPSAPKPNGATMAVLTTYGLDDTAYEALRERWTPWWTKRYPTPDQPPT
jgi:uncharacterized protein YndB with AHSA1/START domain